MKAWHPFFSRHTKYRPRSVALECGIYTGISKWLNIPDTVSPKIGNRLCQGIRMEESVYKFHASRTHTNYGDNNAVDTFSIIF